MLKIREKDIAIISDCVGIPFLSSLNGDGKVCFATNTEVRPEFLESFNEKHVLAYISAFLSSAEFAIKKTIQIPFPENAASFWENIQKGNGTDLLHLETDINVIFYRK